MQQVAMSMQQSPLELLRVLKGIQPSPQELLRVAGGMQQTVKGKPQKLLRAVT